MKKLNVIFPILLTIGAIGAIGPLAFLGCDFPAHTPTSDEVQAHQQEVSHAQGAVSVGFPAIKNFREMRLYKDIFELRDQADLSTFTYTFSEVNGKPKFFCNSIGFPIPYATQYTNPQKIGYDSVNVGVATLPQADPNGLYSPASADGTWVLCKDPKGDKIAPVYVEPKVITTLWELPAEATK